MATNSFTLFHLRVNICVLSPESGLVSGSFNQQCMVEILLCISKYRPYEMSSFHFLSLGILTLGEIAMEKA